MIKKFIKIKGTGRYLNYSHGAVLAPHRTTDFEKINLVYGENGIGKTTLSIILQSLKGNNALLTKKRSFDRSVPQEVEVLTDATPNPKFTYSNDVWDYHYPNVEIFDIHFINNNIYTGFEIQNTHKKNLFEIIFGHQGIQLKNEIQVVKEQIVVANREVREAGTRISGAIENAYTVDAYIRIAADPDIDNKISQKEREIATAKSSEEIQNKSVLLEVAPFPLPFKKEDACAALNSSIAGITETYLKNFQDHKVHLKMTDAENWLKKGFDAIEEDACPFCLRKFDDTVEIIESYNQYFSKEYNDLVGAVSSLYNALARYNLDASLIKIDAAVSSNRGLIDFWNRHVQSAPSVPAITYDKDEFARLLEAIKQDFRVKSANPVQSVNCNSVDAFEKAVAELNGQIANYNAAIKEFNSSIGTLKSSPAANVATLETALKKLKAVKKKGDAAVAGLCANYSTKVQTVITLNASKDTKQEQLDQYSNTLFASYSTKINQYLRLFAPYLEIRNLDSGYVGTSTEPMVRYALHMSGNEIMWDDTTAMPSFKYSLSEGDKSALAFAFFLSKLELGGNLHDKIIVFDDPVSSFDLNRKSATISKLLDFGQQAKQLFVFTHNIVFACEFWKAANQVSATTQCSKIQFMGNSSCIIEYNIDTETLSSVLKDSMAVKNFLNAGAMTDFERRGIARCLRPALESYFHLKFFDIISPNDWLGDFIGSIRNATATNPYFRLQPQLSEFTDLNDYSKKYHHRFNSNADGEPINDTELRAYCERTLNLIQLI